MTESIFSTESDGQPQAEEAKSAMQELFWAYHPLTDQQAVDLWREAFVTFDASVLIDLYQYSPTAVNDFFEVLQSNLNRVWLSHQATLEYQRHRVKAASRQLAEYRKLQTGINQIGDIFRQIVRKVDAERDPLAKDVEDAIRALRSKAKEYQQVQSAVGLREPHSETDAILDQLGKVFGSADTLGAPFSKSELKRIYKRGRKRYAGNIPPGYLDAAEKPEPRRYGDLIIWEQILAEAKRRGCPFIFVTHDLKGDWWRLVDNKPFAPLAELREEARRRVGEDCWFYQLDDFLRNARVHLKATISDDTIDEVSEELHEILEPPNVPFPPRFPPSTSPPSLNSYSLNPYALDSAARAIERAIGDPYYDVAYDRMVRSLARVAEQALNPFDQWLFGGVTNSSKAKTVDSSASDAGNKSKEDGGEAT